MKAPNLYVRINKLLASKIYMIAILRTINPTFNLQTEKALVEGILTYDAIEISQDDFINLMCDALVNVTLAKAIKQCLHTERCAVVDYYPSQYNEKSINISNLGWKV